MKHACRRGTGTLLWGVPALAVTACLFFIPLVFTLKGAFQGPALGEAIRSPYLRGVLAFTLKQALLSTLASLAIGLPGAWIMATYRFPGKKLVRAVSTVPFVLPSILVVLGFVIFYGNNGILNRVLMRVLRLSEPPLHILYSLGAIILAHAFYNFPLVMQLVSTAWIGLDPHPEQASLTLGAGKWRTFLHITLPRLVPAIISAATLVFLYCYNSFSIILVLGGGPAHTTMETEIYRYAKITLEPDKAAVMALVSLSVALLLLVLHIILQKKFAIQGEADGGERKSSRRPSSPCSVLFVALFSLAALLFVLGPILSVVARSLTDKASLAGGSRLSLKWYRQLLGFSSATGTMSTSLEALKHSFAIAFICAAVSLPCTLSLVPMMRKKGVASGMLEVFCMLPMAVSSVIIGLGYLLIATRIGTGGYPLVVMAHLVVAMPVAIRTVIPSARAIPRHYLDAAHTLGADSRTTYATVVFPLLAPSLVTSFAFSFAISLGELNATLTLSGHRIKTLPTVMYQLISAYNYQGACALGTVLIICSFLVFLLNEHAKAKELSA